MQWKTIWTDGKWTVSEYLNQGTGKTRLMVHKNDGSGVVDYPILRGDGTAAYDFPEKVPKNVKDEVAKIFAENPQYST